MKKNSVTSRLKAIIIFPTAVLILLVGGVITGITTAVVGSFFYIALVFPLVMGFAGGNVLTAAVQLTKIRKRNVLLLVSLVVAITIYGTYQYGRYVALQVQTSLVMFSALTEATDGENLKVAKVFVDYALEQETGYSGVVGYMLFKAQEGVSIGRFYSQNRLNLGLILTWLYWVFEFGIILWVIMGMSRKFTRMPFCEFCGNWYGREKHLGGTGGTQEPFLLDLLKQKDFMELGKLMEQNADLPSLELYVQRCETCEESVSNLSIRRAFKGSKGSLQFSDVVQTTLLPKEYILLSQQLQFAI